MRQYRAVKRRLKFNARSVETKDKNEKLTVVNSRCVTVARLQLQRIIFFSYGTVFFEEHVARRSCYDDSDTLREGTRSKDIPWIRDTLSSSSIVRLFARFIHRIELPPLSTKGYYSRLCIALCVADSEPCLNFGQARNTSRDVSSASVTCNYA